MSIMEQPAGGHRARSPQGWQNVGTLERMASTIGGGGLLVGGLMRGTLGGVVLALTGLALLRRGISGHCGLYGALGLSTAGHGPHLPGRAHRMHPDDDMPATAQAMLGQTTPAPDYGRAPSIAPAPIAPALTMQAP